MQYQKNKVIIKHVFISFVLVLVLTIVQLPGVTLQVNAADHNIVILYTNDVHCGVDDNFGYAGLAQ